MSIRNPKNLKTPRLPKNFPNDPINIPRDRLPGTKDRNVINPLKRRPRSSGRKIKVKRKKGQ